MLRMRKADVLQPILTFFTLCIFLSVQGSHLSKYGFRTESSGSVNIRMNIAHHSRYTYSQCTQVSVTYDVLCKIIALYSCSHLIKKKKELPALSFKYVNNENVVVMV